MKKPFCLPEFALWLFVAAMCSGLSGTVWMLPVALIARAGPDRVGCAVRYGRGRGHGYRRLRLQL